MLLAATQLFLPTSFMSDSTAHHTFSIYPNNPILPTYWEREIYTKCTDHREYDAVDFMFTFSVGGQQVAKIHFLIISYNSKHIEKYNSEEEHTISNPFYVIKIFPFLSQNNNKTKKI